MAAKQLDRMERAAGNPLFALIARGVQIILLPLVVWAVQTLISVTSDLKVVGVKLDNVMMNHYTSLDAQRDNQLITSKIDNTNILLRSTIDSVKDRVDRLERQLVRAAPERPVVPRNGSVR